MTSVEAWLEWFEVPKDDADMGSAFALVRYHAITCNGVVATLVGTAGNNHLIGTNSPDVIVSFDGNDSLSRPRRQR